MITLYRGPLLLLASSTSDSTDHRQLLFSQQSEWLIGGLLFALVCILSAIWNVAQVNDIQSTNSHLSMINACISLIIIVGYYIWMELDEKNFY